MTGLAHETKRRLGPVDVDVTSSDSASRVILDAMRERRSLLVAFSNANTINIARKDYRLQRSLASAMVLNDGVGVDLASRILHGRSFPENLNGTDFCPRLLELADNGSRVYLLGGEKGVAQKAGVEIERRYPGVRVVGTRDGFFGPGETDEILAEAMDVGATLMLVGMGQPKQEIWAARHSPQFAGPMICVGACLDFLAGKFPRAPRIIRQLRLEWAYRLMKEPRRLARRYLVGNFVFLFGVLREKMGGGNKDGSH
ncbi:WecB/TagA/CpsF family glycosyltransferase [Altererythrobacter sp. Z27]|uniref:WecB/TagA/CpsF family glycosyltransferase n=1 Tax=Altererythrobacter sp. Z27 TaxID=3461147 RepID=UPI004044E447